MACFQKVLTKKDPFDKSPFRPIFNEVTEIQRLLINTPPAELLICLKPKKVGLQWCLDRKEKSLRGVHCNGIRAGLVDVALSTDCSLAALLRTNLSHDVHYL